MSDSPAWAGCPNRGWVRPLRLPRNSPKLQLSPPLRPRLSSRNNKPSPLASRLRKKGKAKKERIDNVLPSPSLQKLPSSFLPTSLRNDSFLHPPPAIQPPPSTTFASFSERKTSKVNVVKRENCAFGRFWTFFSFEVLTFALHGVLRSPQMHIKKK
eukprot:RCo021376